MGDFGFFMNPPTTTTNTKKTNNINNNLDLAIYKSWYKQLNEYRMLIQCIASYDVLIPPSMIIDNNNNNNNNNK
eukprot:UN10705